MMHPESAGPPTFSVVVPTHGRREQLARCLAALSAQDLPADRFEVIVVDDGSPEPVETVVDPFRDGLALRVLRCRRQGPAGARNQGARAARGTVLAFTDDDCLPQPGWLRAIAAGLNGANTALGGKTLNAAPDHLCSTASQAIVDWAYAFYNGGPGGPRFFASNNLAVPRARFLELGGFDHTFTTAEDRELCDRWRHQGLALAYAPDAQIAHASEPSLIEFVRRHFRYGRGAYRFNVARRARGSGSIARDASFYRELPRQAGTLIRAGGPVRGSALAGLLLLWQFANTAGFLWEAARNRRPLGPREGRQP
jgi:glycosyltransferase involved in cell wall biosynthesis